MKSFRKVGAVWLILALCLSGCAENGTVFPLESAPDAQGRFDFSMPEGWQSQTEGAVSSYTPSDYDGSEEDLRVLLYLAPTNTFDTQEHIEIASPMIQDFLSDYLDDDYEVVDQGEIKVDKYPAMKLYFGKPHGDTYMVGQVVITAMPGVVVIFLGTGIRADWDAFEPSFKAMLDDFHLISAFTPTPPQS